MDSSFLLLLGLFAAFVVGSLLYNTLHGRKRTAALEQIARQLGFDFAGPERDHHPATPDLRGPLFQGGEACKFSNSMMGTFAGLRSSIFDYRYSVRGPRSTRVWKQTVAAFSQELWLPEFEFRTENFLDRIADEFTHQDIDFDSFPEFSRRFLLRGPSANGIRKLFSPALISFLQVLPEDVKWRVEGCGATLIIYQLDCCVPADLDSYRCFLEKTSEIARAFFSTPENLSKPVR